MDELHGSCWDKNIDDRILKIRKRLKLKRAARSLANLFGNAAYNELVQTHPFARCQVGGFSMQALR